MRLGAGLFLTTIGFGNHGIQTFFTVLRYGRGEAFAPEGLSPALPFFDAVITIWLEVGSATTSIQISAVQVAEAVVANKFVIKIIASSRFIQHCFL